MILVDERTGSKELLQDLRAYGVDAEIGGKLAADFEFVGNGPNGSQLIGFERKTVTDLLDSMREKRLAGSQAKAMIDTYERRFIIIEGLWRRGDGTGLVEILSNREWKPARGQFRFSEVNRFLSSMREFGGFHIWRTSSQRETASFIAEEWHWWNKPWADHTTHKTLYNPDPTRKSNGRPSLWRQESPLLELWIGKLPGIDSRAEEVATYFESAQDMADAPLCRWERIKGIGPKTAAKIIAEIRKENPKHIAAPHYTDDDREENF